MKKIEFFKIEDNRINRIRKHCPKCGPAVFLAEHKNRFSCGKCGYAEFKGGGKPSKPLITEQKQVEKSVTPKKYKPVENSSHTIESETPFGKEPSTEESSVDESIKKESSIEPASSESSEVDTG